MDTEEGEYSKREARVDGMRCNFIMSCIVYYAFYKSNNLVINDCDNEVK